MRERKTKYMVRSGTWCRTICTIKFLNKLFLTFFSIKKPRHRLTVAIFGNHPSHHGSQKRPSAAPISVPQPPYSRMWCPYVTPKRSERPLAATGPVRNPIVFVMRGFGKISIEKSWCHPFLPSWRWSAPMARLGPTHGTNTGSRAPIFGYGVL